MVVELMKLKRGMMNYRPNPVSYQGCFNPAVLDHGHGVLGSTIGASLRRVKCISSHKRSFSHIGEDKVQKNQAI